MEDDPKTLEDAIKQINSLRSCISVKLEEIRELNKEITRLELRSPEQGGEMREDKYSKGYHEGYRYGVAHFVPEYPDITIPSFATPREGAEPAEEREPEVDALLWMTEHVMGTDSAETIRGWLARYRADGRLVIRDMTGAEIERYAAERERKARELAEKVRKHDFRATPDGTEIVGHVMTPDEAAAEIERYPMEDTQ